MLYNEAKEQRDKRHNECKEVMKENVLCLLDKSPQKTIEKVLNDYVDFCLIESELSKKFKTIKETWGREDIKQKEKQVIVDALKKEVKELKKKAIKFKGGKKKAEAYVKKLIREEFKAIEENNRVNPLLKKYYEWTSLREKIKEEKDKKGSNKIKLASLRIKEREIRPQYYNCVSIIEGMVKKNIGLQCPPKEITFVDQYSLIKSPSKYDEGLKIGLQQTLKRLEDSYQAFFKRCSKGETPGFPNFKSWKKWDTIITRQSGWEVRGSKVYLSKIGLFRIKFHRELPERGEIKTASLIMENGKYWISFGVEYESMETDIPMTGKECGIDMGVRNYVTLDNCVQWKYPRFLEEIQRELRILNRSLDSKTDKKSKRRKRVREKITRLYYHLKCRRKDYINNLVYQLVCTYDIFYVEDLNVKNMMEQKYVVGGRYLRRKLSDAAFRMFLTTLKNKCLEVGKEVIEVPSKDTSQTCRICGDVRKPGDRMTLHDKIYECRKCDHVEDRDINSAKFILEVGRKIRQGKELQTV